jgi:transposase
MDRHIHSAQLRQLEVIETGRRRRWSEDEKLKIVLESLPGGATGATIVRLGAALPCGSGKKYKKCCGLN